MLIKARQVIVTAKQLGIAVAAYSWVALYIVCAHARNVSAGRLVGVF